MPSFADHFSPTAAAYAAYRPRYPDALFRWLASVAHPTARVWDCGTGSGQAAVALATWFREVVATDPSEAQLREASRAPRITYAAMTAERCALATGSVGLVTVAQAVHWFDRSRFYDEVRRVSAPDGVVALWSYALGSLGDEALDEALSRFHHDTLGPFWPAERAIVAAGYGSLEFPFDELSAPAVEMTARWTMAHLAGYLSSWSAVQRARAATGADPLGEFLRTVEPMWGDPGLERTVRWPLSVRAGRVDHAVREGPIALA